MRDYSTTKRYCPHQISTKLGAVNLYRQSHDVDYVCRKYHVSKASLMRWNKRYNGTKESIQEKSHKPLSRHPRAHTEQEIQWIRDYHRRNPNITICELYGKLHDDKGYTRHPGSLYRVFVKLGFRKKQPVKKGKQKHLKPYDTPTTLGVKWQMDVKYVPSYCYVGNDGEKFYQYTMLEEASRKRFIYPYREQSGFSTIDFVKRAIAYFGHIPITIQTDNGGEFTNFSKTKRIHIFDKFCQEMGIIHQLIRPRTPWHNGKVERSHRNDQERFYNFMHFYSYEDLLVQMRHYLYRSNNIPMAVLGWKSPMKKQLELENFDHCGGR